MDPLDLLVNQEHLDKTELTEKTACSERRESLVNRVLLESGVWTESSGKMVKKELMEIQGTKETREIKELLEIGVLQVSVQSDRQSNISTIYMVTLPQVISQL